MKALLLLCSLSLSFFAYATTSPAEGCTELARNIATTSLDSEKIAAALVQANALFAEVCMQGSLKPSETCDSMTKHLLDLQDQYTALQMKLDALEKQHAQGCEDFFTIGLDPCEALARDIVALKKSAKDAAIQADEYDAFYIEVCVAAGAPKGPQCGEMAKLLGKLKTAAYQAASAANVAEGRYAKECR